MVRKAQPKPPRAADPRDDVLVYVQTCPARRDTIGATLASLDASDAAGRYVVIEHPDGVAPQQFYVDALRQAAGMGKRVIVRIEDDAEVNAHLLHNVLTWPALSNPAFGMGFLSNANNWTPAFDVDDAGCYRAVSIDVSAALGQVWRTESVPAFLAALERQPAHRHALQAGTINYDNVASEACRAIGAGVYVHVPSIVRESEHGRSVSTWGNVGDRRHPAQHDFAPTWRRQQLIPKIIHQIWIGDLEPPTAMMQTWRDLNPTWEHRIWRDATGWRTQAAIDAVSRMHGKADMMRYEILAEHGGIYVDADAECVRPLPDWLCEREAMTCWESETHRPGIAANGYMGSAPGGAAVCDIMERAGLVTTRGDPDVIWRTIGSGLWSEVLRTHPEVHVWPARMFIPRHFTGAVAQGVCPVFALQHWGSTMGYAGLAARAAASERTLPAQPIPGRGIPPFQHPDPVPFLASLPPLPPPPPTLSICIASLESRAESLAAVLAQLGANPRVEILTDVDDGETPVYQKRNRLLARATGRYVCAVDDDDTVSPKYLPAILAAIDAGNGADAVLLRAERVRQDTGETVAVDYYTGTAPPADGTDWRTPDHLTPVRRELAQAVPFPAVVDNEDVAWRRALLPHINRTVRAAGTLYRYQWDPSKPRRAHRVDSAAPVPPPAGAITLRVRQNGNGYVASVPHGPHYHGTATTEAAARQKAVAWILRTFPGAAVAEV